MVQTRSKGHTATAAVCYRMGLAAASTIPGADGLERRFDYTRRTGIVATGWAAPPGTDESWGDPITWAHRIEAVDKRKNSRQCRDDVVGIPVELVEAGVAEEVVQAYADRLAAEHKTVVHYALHRPDRGGKNYHAHVLYPGRHVEGMTFSRKRDREQDNPKDGDPDLVTRHKTIWSELCRDRGIELDWTSEAPGHHLGPALCAVKRGRLVEETRETIRVTVAASRPGEPLPGERTLQAVAEIASRVNDGLTVTEMLERERREVLHGRPAPRPVPAPAPFQPEVVPAAAGAPEVLPPVRRAEVLPLARRAPEVLPPARTAPEVLPLARRAPEVLPPVRRAEVLPLARRAPEVLPPARTTPEVLPPRQETPRVLPPARQPEVLPPARHQAAVFPPRDVAARIVADQLEVQHPAETAATLSEVDRHLEQQRQTLAHELARAAVGKRREDARKRKRAPAPPASASTVRRIAAWVLNCARQILERLGLKPGAAPEHEADRAPVQPEACTPPAPEPRPEPNLWKRYEARWPDAAADLSILEDLTEKPLPEALAGNVGISGIEGWRRGLQGMFQGEPPTSLPPSLAPAGEAGPAAAVHAAGYVGSLPSRYRARFDQERIVERSLEAAEPVRQTLRYRLAGEERRQTLEEDAIRAACGEDAQRLDREMRAERRQWQEHWNVLVRHDTLLQEEEQERENQRQLDRLRESMEQSRRPVDRDPEDRGGPSWTM